MKDLDLYSALQNGTKVWFVEDTKELTKDKCHDGMIIFLGIKKGKTQVEILVGDKEGEGVSLEGEHFRASSENVFAIFEEMKAFLLGKLSEAKSVIEANITDVGKLSIEKEG